MSSKESGENTLDRIIAERREKAAKLRELGRNPYGNSFRPTHSCGQVRERYEASKPDPEAERPKGMNPVDGEVIRLAGRVMAKRGFGKTVFAPIRDHAGQVQLFINVKHVAAEDFEQIMPFLDAGDIVGAEGVIFWTKTGEMSLLCKRVHIISKSLRPLPEKWHGLTDVETRYRQRYLDLASNTDVRDVFRKRSQIVRGIRRFLDDRGYLEVETPMMHPIIGGAAARPFITHHNALDMKLYMRIAPELYLKRLVVGGFERVYEINRNFRNEGLSRQHNPEFTMLEFYQAYATYEDLMVLTEELISGLCTEVNGATTTTWEEVEINLEPPWRRLSVKEAVIELGGKSAKLFEDAALAAEVALEAGVNPDGVMHAMLEPLDADAVKALAAKHADGGGAHELIKAFAANKAGRTTIAAAIADAYGDELTGRVCAGHLGYLIFDEVVEKELVQPTFLTDFPLAVSPLARKKEADPAFCDRFELFVGGKEIANAFSELNDPDDQRSRFLAQLQAREQGADETMDYDEDYCRALEVGMPSAAGEGIGIDRLTMMLTGQDSIRDVILFPLMREQGR